jgi:hypothetical protein
MGPAPLGQNPQLETSWKYASVTTDCLLFGTGGCSGALRPENLVRAK